MTRSILPLPSFHLHPIPTSICLNPLPFVSVKRPVWFDEGEFGKKASFLGSSGVGISDLGGTTRTEDRREASLPKKKKKERKRERINKLLDRGFGSKEVVGGLKIRPHFRGRAKAAKDQGEEREGEGERERERRAASSLRVKVVCQKKFRSCTTTTYFDCDDVGPSYEPPSVKERLNVT
ncbi:hypothetical protein IE53DRAFT_247783 [Violaceomyces palustris]|uniref:Uncharacterized protein n=1 Tax=Violaceomyces palustris TaxID=1673888 RepID=A0ACD0NNU0_9BASI|nr:hypothetical protein IE53DRAFT_247783 [Violaceomyces palustris]